MGLREFRDAEGIEWKMWDILADAMHPVTAREMFVGDYQEGWLVMESATERRRIAPIPTGWTNWPDAALDELVARASVVPMRGNAARPTPAAGVPRYDGLRAGIETQVASAGARIAAARTAVDDAGDQHAPEADADDRQGSDGHDPALPADDFDPHASRSFTGPGGQRWTARLVALRSAPEPVLRFTSDSDAVCDLRLWPTDWERQSTEQLVALLRRATPAAAGSPREAPHEATQRRRREDRRP